MKWEVYVTLKGPARTIEAPTTPPTLEAETIMGALRLLAKSAEFPDSDVKTIGLRIVRAEGE